MSEPFNGKAAHMQEIKAKEYLYYTYAQVSFCSKAGLFSELRTGPSNSNPAFLVVFSVILQLKPCGLPENVYLAVLKVDVTHFHVFCNHSFNHNSCYVLLRLVF